MSFLLKAPAVLIVAGFLLPWVQTAAAQEEPSALQLHKTESAQRKTDLELQKLELEIANSKKKLTTGPCGLVRFSLLSRPLWALLLVF
jgi:hypothetical protein